jgi:uncharacterized membrane protein
MASPPFNPYAPPKAPDLPATAPAIGDFDIGQTVTDAWENSKRHFPLWLGVGLVAGFLIVLSLVTIIGAFVLAPVLGWGATKFLLNLHDGSPSFDDLFSGFKNYLTVLGRTLLLFAISFVLGALSEGLVLAGNLTDSMPLVVIGYVVYFAFLVGVHLRFTFALFLIVDRDLGAIAALGASWNMTRGKTLKLVGFVIVASLLGGAGFFACGIGLVWSMTMSWLMYASAYRQTCGPSQRPVPMTA